MFNSMRLIGGLTDFVLYAGSIASPIYCVVDVLDMESRAHPTSFYLHCIGTFT